MNKDIRLHLNVGGVIISFQITWIGYREKTLKQNPQNKIQAQLFSLGCYLFQSWEKMDEKVGKIMG